MAGSDDLRRRLLELLKQEAVQHGEFTLASGAKSSYYIDGRRVTLHPEGAVLIGKLILEMLADEEIDAIGGPTMGADPIIGATIALSQAAGRPLRGFIVRKEQKAHGMQRTVEGPIRDGDRVVIVEDVVTSGGSVLKAIQQVEACGASIVRVIAVLDRLAGAQGNFAEAGYTFTPIFTLDALGLT